MSQAIAAHLIMHPTITRTLKVLATTVGRDKTYRLIQYLARLIAWSLLRHGGVDAKMSAMRWDGLKSGLASGRKMLRLVKPLEHLQSAVAFANTPIPAQNLAPYASATAQFAQIARQLCYAGYLSTDMIVWLQSVKFLKIDPFRFAKISKISQRFWLSGICFSLLSSISALARLRAEGRRLALSRSVEGYDLGAMSSSGAGSLEKSSMGPQADDERKARGMAMLKERSTLVSQIVQDSMDFWIPATNLGFANLNDGVLGALGAATSYMALQQQWIKVNGSSASSVKRA